MKTTIVVIEQDREQYLDLLLLADPSPAIVHNYLNEGILLALSLADTVIGTILLIPQTADTIEIKNLAVTENMQGKGYGQQLAHYALDFCRQQGYGRVIVGTGNSGIRQFAFYQKVGFRFFSIVRDFFTQRYPEPIFEHGIQCRDMLFLEVDFAAR